MTRFEFLKLAHVGCVILSITFFQIRAWRVISGAALEGFLYRVLPHVIDTVLLLSAIGMLLTIHLNPFSTPWLLAKILALLVYIALGFSALKGNADRGRRVLLVLAATLCFAYIVGVALTHRPEIFW